MVTIVVGSSLLVLNVLIFIGVYYQLDGRSKGNNAATDEDNDSPDEELKDGLIDKKEDASPITSHRETNSNVST